MKTFNSKIDLWLIIALTFSIGVSVWGAWDLIVNQASNSSFVLAFFLLVLGVGLPTWLMVRTKYIVVENTLNIVSGPFSWKIEISSINKVSNSRNLMSSPALSLDRLEIEFQHNKRILVSPKNKNDFLAAINQPLI